MWDYRIVLKIIDMLIIALFTVLYNLFLMESVLYHYSLFVYCRDRQLALGWLGSQGEFSKQYSYSRGLHDLHEYPILYLSYKKDITEMHRYTCKNVLKLYLPTYCYTDFKDLILYQSKQQFRFIACLLSSSSPLMHITQIIRWLEY